MTISRRLLLTCLSAFSVSAEAGHAIGYSRQSRLGPLVRDLASLLSEWPQFSTIGSRYLTDHPEEASMAKLTALLDKTIGMCFSADKPCDLPQTAQRLSDAVVADFEQSRICLLDGWVVSRTEARLCALLALQEGLRPEVLRSGELDTDRHR